MFMFDPLNLFLIYILIIIAAVIHEYSHGWTADLLGDPTARYAGRLTLNPIAHMDIWGTVIIPLIFMLSAGILFGAAKPVPFNPYNLKNQKYGAALVGLAGPASNLIIAALLGFTIKSMSTIVGPALEILKLAVLVNISIAIFNLIPLPPLDGSKIIQVILPAAWRRMMVFTSGPMALAGIILAVFVASFFVRPIVEFLYGILVGSPLVL